MKELIRVRVQYASRQQCCKTHKRPLPLPLPLPYLTALLPLTHFPSPPRLLITPHYHFIFHFRRYRGGTRGIVGDGLHPSNIARGCDVGCTECACTEYVTDSTWRHAARFEALVLRSVLCNTYTDIFQSNPICTRQAQPGMYPSSTTRYIPVKHNHWALLKYGYVFRPVNPTITIFQYKAQYIAVCSHTVGLHRMYGSLENVKLH